jgi:hypothetical protein
VHEPTKRLDSNPRLTQRIRDVTGSGCSPNFNNTKEKISFGGVTVTGPIATAGASCQFFLNKVGAGPVHIKENEYPDWANHIKMDTRAAVLLVLIFCSVTVAARHDTFLFFAPTHHFCNLYFQVFDAAISHADFAISCGPSMTDVVFLAHIVLIATHRSQ